ncbi:MAG: TIGR02556 family CRISPR-associated protein, partial [Spirochaetes bacterium]|nr:TIGR02556 family CRISPR-associated protein [Spirochaetota bacterium]
MIEAIRNLGENVSKYSRERFIYSMINEKINEGYLLTINFNLNQNKITIEYPKEVNDSIIKEYLWVGNNRGNLPQDRLTTNNIEYILSGSLVNLYKNLEDCELKAKLKKLIDNFYLKINSEYFLDISKIDNFTLSSNEITEKINYILSENIQKKDQIIKILNFLKESFFDCIKKNNLLLDFKEKDIALYSVMIDDMKPSDISDYIDYLESNLIDEPFDNAKLEGKCYVCGEYTLLTSDTRKFFDKYYMTDLIIFASELDKNKYSRNFNLCKNCYKNILVGSRFLSNKLNFKLFGTNFYLIPSFIFKPTKFESIIDKFIIPLKEDFMSINSLDNFLKFIEEKEKILKNYIDYFKIKNYINLILLFYERDNQSFKIQKLIKDIPSRRVEELRDALEYINNFGNEIIGREDKNWILSFDVIFYFFPIKMDKNRGVGLRKILELYEKILNKSKIDILFLIDEFNSMIKTYYFANTFTQIKISINEKKYLDAKMVRAILQTNLFLKFLKIQNLIDGGDIVINNLDEFLLNDELKNYIKKMGFDEQKAALFLLGYLIGEIGKKQRNLETNRKPILDKINYSGMN